MDFKTETPTMTPVAEPVAKQTDQTEPLKKPLLDSLLSNAQPLEAKILEYNEEIESINKLYMESLLKRVDVYTKESKNKSELLVNYKQTITELANMFNASQNSVRLLNERLMKLQPVESTQKRPDNVM